MKVIELFQKVNSDDIVQEFRNRKLKINLKIEYEIKKCVWGFKETEILKHMSSGTLEILPDGFRIDSALSDHTEMFHLNRNSSLIVGNLQLGESFTGLERDNPEVFNYYVFHMVADIFDFTGLKH